MAVALLAVPQTAIADDELWAVYEHRIPLVKSFPEIPRLTLRVATETVLNNKDGLQTALLRTGPMFDVSSWLYVAAHGTLLANRVGSEYKQQYRTELELDPYGSLGPFKWNGRTRQEITFAAHTKTDYRLRQMLRLSLPLPTHPRWIPFVADETFFTPTGPKAVSEVRNMLGVGFKISPEVRMDLGYALRNRYGIQGWEIDHAVFAVFLFDVPHQAGAGVVN